MKKMLFFMLYVIVSCVNNVFSDYPDQPFIDYISASGEKVKLKDGVDLSEKNLENIPVHERLLIHREGGTLKNINFSKCYMYRPDFRETRFENCNFSGAVLKEALFEGNLKGCNFTDAEIKGADIFLNGEQLKSTADYKRKDLSGTVIYGNFFDVDFSGFDLSFTSFHHQLDKCNLTDAKIKGITIWDWSYGKLEYSENVRIEQLLTTRDFKEGFVDGIEVNQLAWPKDQVVNLSKMVFVNCKLSCANQAKIDLTDSVISNCNFENFKGLTLENIKSTWNYKNNRMVG